MSKLILAFALMNLLILSYSQTDNVTFRLFEKEDKDLDGILTTFQFIKGLTSAFVNLGIDNDIQLINDFGWEFAGHKKTKGSISLLLIKEWIKTEELISSFNEWRHIIEEGENHHIAGHRHISRKNALKNH
ncbi:hypothetical protein SteCoe_33667 [Stentor coeruleus]|uniref:EF-hand domain-containing protein n=1 Tax=Stentor coeruleus TaxID=5963 RepID=A0A1R2AW77_9CILI|nr:hypothetical protein SteCoe_33667 [Stentor coeruleus]